MQELTQRPRHISVIHTSNRRHSGAHTVDDDEAAQTTTCTAGRCKAKYEIKVAFSKRNEKSKH